MNHDASWRSVYSEALTAAGGTPPERRYCVACKWSTLPWRAWWDLLGLDPEYRRSKHAELLRCRHPDGMWLHSMDSYNEPAVLGPPKPLPGWCHGQRNESSPCGKDAKLWEPR